MSEWQLIETARKDGSYVLVTDGTRFAAAQSVNYTEPATLGYDYGPGSVFPSTLRPNPEAGKVRQFWCSVGCSAWTHDADTFDYDGPLSITPTHWMPLPSPPSTPA